jgi:glutathione S-transferase
MILGKLLKLYQFPISHYCEKARWALQFKNAVFEQINLPPGLHKIMIKRKAPSAKSPITVPLLTAGAEVIQGSGPIISYIDRMILEKPLGFSDRHLQEQSAELEFFLDETIATLLRSIAYNMLLKDRKYLISFWSMDGPFYTRAWLTLTIPYLARLIKQMYKTDPGHVAEYQDRFNAGMDRLDRVCESHRFMVGDRFSRADLTLAAILAPLNFPKEHPYPNPAPLPDELQRFCEEHSRRPTLIRVSELYREYRHNA